MRSASQITRTPREWVDHQQAEREQTLRELLGVLRAARERGDEWYRWVAGGCRPLTRDEYASLRPGAAPPAASQGTQATLGV